MTEIFNEDSLFQEITKIWGEYGAHAEVYQMLLKDRREQKETIAALKHGLAEALGGWGQWLVNYPDAIEKDKLNRLYDLLK
jgi:hypothetical protein